MAAPDNSIPKALLALKPSKSLESVAISVLARQGTSMLRQMVTNAQPVALNLQGQPAMVTLPQQQYDALVELIQHWQADKESEYLATLTAQFDALVAQMNQPGAGKAVDDALFSGPEALNANYQPGTTETDV